MLQIAVTSVTTIFLLCMIPRWPMAIIGLYACIPFYKNAVNQILLIDATFLLASLSVIVLGLMAFRHGVIPKIDVLILWSLFLLVVIIGMIYSTSEIVFDRGVSFVALTYTPLLPLLFVGRSEDYKSQFLLTVGLVGVVNLSSALYTILVGDIGNRLALSTSNTIGVSRSIILIPIILIATRQYWSAWRAYGAIGLSSLSFMIAFATGSRGSLLAGVIAIAFALALDAGFWKRLMNTAVYSAVVIPALSVPAILILTRLPEASAERIFGFVQVVLGSPQHDLDNSASQRIGLAKLALQMFDQSPLLGHGVGSFYTFASIRSDVVTTEYPHNLVLHVLAELGVAGFFVVVGFIGYCILIALGGIARSPLNLALFAIAIDMLVNAMFSNSIYDFRLLWASLIAAACATPTMYAGRKRSTARPDRKLRFKYRGRLIGPQSP